MPPEAARHRRLGVVADCDTGIDDAVALAYLARSPLAELVAVSSVEGNTDAVQAAANSAFVLSLAGLSQTPVAVGRSNGGRRSGGPHGADGLCGLGPPAVAGSATPLSQRAWWESWTAAETVPALLASGPLTNLAAVCARLSPPPARVVVMGGRFVPGDAEANFAADPAAAGTVMALPWRLTLVPFDATIPIRASERSVEQMAGSSDPLVSFCGRALGCYARTWGSRSGLAGAPLHDAIAAVLLVRPELAVTLRAAVEVSLGPPGRGTARLVEPGAASGGVEVVREIDAAGVFAELSEVFGVRVELA